MLLTLAFMVAAFIGERLAPDVAERALSRSGTLAAFAAFMSAGAAISAAPGTTAAEVAAEGLLIGAPMALTLMAWGKTLGANPPRLAATEIFAATGIAAACCFALWFAPEEIGLALRCVLPFAGVAFMEIARHEQSSATSETMHPTPIKPARARTLPPACSQVLLSLAWLRASLRPTEATPARFPRPHSPMPCSSWLCSAAAF